MSAINAKASRKMKKYAVLTREPRCFLGSLAFSWEQRKLGDMMNVTSVKRIHQSDWTDSGVRFLRARDIVAAAKNEEPDDYLYISKEKYEEYSALSGKVGVSDLLVTGVGTIGVPYLVRNLEPLYFKDGNIIWFQNSDKIDGKFLFYSFSAEQIQGFINESAGIGTVGTYTIESGKKTPISLPNQIEQAKVGEFFQQLDNLITLHQRKFEKLTNVKKSMLEKMFPQNGSSYPEIRFKGFTDPWEQREVGDLLIERSQQAPMSDEYPLMAFIANEGVAPKGERYDRSALVTDTVNKLYKKTEKGDFIYSSNNLETGSIGLNKYGKACISPVYSIFEPTGIADSDFLGRRLVRKDFINAMVKWRQGVIYGQWRIHESDFLKIEISVPSVEEQRKIGAYLDQLDNLITLHQRQPFLHSPPDISLIVQLTPPFYTFSWEQRKWINTVDISTNMVDPKSGKYDLLPHVAPGNIESFTGRLYDNVKLVGEENLISGKFVFNVGDIVYGKINPQLGKYVFARFSGLTSADAYVLNAKNGIVQKFLYAVIQTRDFYDYSVSVSKRSGMPKINRDELNAYSYWAPSESEQLKIGEYLLTLDHLITLHQRQTIVYAVIRSIRKVILAERQYFAPPMVRKSP